MAKPNKKIIHDTGLNIIGASIKAAEIDQLKLKVNLNGINLTIRQFFLIHSEYLKIPSLAKRHFLQEYIR